MSGCIVTVAIFSIEQKSKSKQCKFEQLLTPLCNEFITMWLYTQSTCIPHLSCTFQSHLGNCAWSSVYTRTRTGYGMWRREYDLKQWSSLASYQLEWQHMNTW